MNCPNDNETLIMSERSGIEIDYCPKCRGVWLDRGELDKIIEANGKIMTASSPTQSIATPQVDNTQHAPQEYRFENDRRQDKSYKKSHKRESFLGDLFDF